MNSIVNRFYMHIHFFEFNFRGKGDLGTRVFEIKIAINQIIITTKNNKHN